MSKMTSKGQVTIPKPVRDLLRLKAGSEVRFEVTAGQVQVKSATAPRKIKKHLNALRGIGVSGMTTDEIMALTRGPDWSAKN